MPLTPVNTKVENQSVRSLFETMAKRGVEFTTLCFWTDGQDAETDPPDAVIALALDKSARLLASLGEKIANDQESAVLSPPGHC